MASQYRLTYGSDLDRSCWEGTGSRTIATECRTNPQITVAFGATPSATSREEKCIFPFIYRQKLYRECMVSPTADFVFQVVCPTVCSTSRINGTNNYGDRALALGYCLNDNKEVDLEIYDCHSGPRQVFSQCKNNCPGGKLAMISSEIRSHLCSSPWFWNSGRRLSGRGGFFYVRTGISEHFSEHR